jgi:hypothetical protein
VVPELSFIHVAVFVVPYAFSNHALSLADALNLVTIFKFYNGLANQLAILEFAFQNATVVIILCYFLRLTIFA